MEKLPANAVLFPPLNSKSAEALQALVRTIEAELPIPTRARKQLPHDVRALWSSLTRERSGRRLDYLNDKEIRSAYLRYFMPWNVYRFSRLLPSLSLNLKAGSRILDIGSGPLSLPIALWLSRPELRDMELKFFCLDRSPGSMADGEKLLIALANSMGAGLKWKIVRIKDSFGSKRLEGMDLICAAYVLNELFQGSMRDLDVQGAKVGAKIVSQLAPTADVLILEPGLPGSAAGIASLRRHFMREGLTLLAPCTHAESCPASGKLHGPWCHFTFDSNLAPRELNAISAQAGLPKEGLALSFLHARRVESSDLALASKGGQGQSGGIMDADGERLRARVISEDFALPGGSRGSYLCATPGRLLLRSKLGSSQPKPGDLVEVLVSDERDPKSGCFLAIC